MRRRSLLTIIIMSMIASGCAGSTTPVAETKSDAASTTQDLVTDQNDVSTEPEMEYPQQNDDGSYTYPFTFSYDYLSTDFAGKDVLDTTEEYPRERFEDVFMFSKGAYLNDPSVPPEFFDEWGCACDCKVPDAPDFGFDCVYSKNIDGSVAFAITDINYCLAVQWEKGQVIYHLWDNELSIVLDRRRGREDSSIKSTKEILAHNDIMGADAKEFVDSFDEGLYEKVLSTLSDNVTAYSPLFHFDNGVMRAKNISEDTIGFEFLLPDKGRRVYEISVDKVTGKVYGTIYRTSYPGENFYSYPSGVEWDENGPVINEDYTAQYPKYEEKTPDEVQADDQQSSDTATNNLVEEKPAASTGAVIDEEEFEHGVMLSAKQGTIVNDEFASGVKNSMTAQLDGMGALAASDPASLIYRRKPFRFGTSSDEAANAMINDVLPMYNFDVTGKNYFISSVEKFDNGYVVTVGWTRWN